MASIACCTFGMTMSLDTVVRLVAWFTRWQGSTTWPIQRKSSPKLQINWIFVSRPSEAFLCAHLAKEMMIANTRHHRLTALGLMVMFALVLLAFKEDKERLSLEGLTMGTSYKIQLLEVPGEEDPGVLADKVQTILSRLDREIFSTYAPNSELSRLNNHAVGTPFAVSREMLDVLMLADTVFSSTSGAFDPTVGPLVSLWGFGPKMSLTELNLPGSSELRKRYREWALSIC